MNNKHHPYIIAEIAQAHDGSLGMVHSYIDIASKIGLDAVKFQAHYADQESTKDESFRIPMSGQDKSRYDYWKRMEFTLEQWLEIKKHCDAINIDFICSPFSEYAVDILSKIEMKIWKIGSGEIIDKSLLEYILNKDHKHIFISAGMLLEKEVSDLVYYMNRKVTDWTLMHCTSLYPTPIEKINLNRISQWKECFNSKIGFSDHSANINVAIASIALGINAYEGHIVFDKMQYGPDSSSSLTVEEFKKLKNFRDDYALLLAQPVSTNENDMNIRKNRKLFSKSLALKKNLKIGTIIEEAMLTLKKPGTGIPKEQILHVIGKRLKTDWSHDRILQWDAFE